MKDTTMRRLIAALLVLAGIGTASADIRINQSRYLDGQLLVAGSTAPGRTVTLDDKYKTKSDAEGHFRFSLKYKPPTCMSDIRAGEDVYSAVIAGCLDPGFGDDTLPSVKPVKKTSSTSRH
jgi:hypothetical protein